MTKYLLFLFAACAISFVTTPLVRSLAQKLRILDIPSERKIHKSPVPLLGGIPLFLAFNLTLLLGILLRFEYLNQFTLPQLLSLFAAQLVILGAGIYDDVKKVKPRTKFLFQLLAGLLLVLFGFAITHITNPFSGVTVNLGLFGIPLTILWVVGITNALNLVDGLDGLAAGTSLIACITIFGFSFLNQNIGVAFVSLILAGSILGFLRYNFHPAKIFLGDSGSLLLGFLLAVLSLKGSSKGATMVSVLAPVLALGLPIMDTLLTMVRRFLKSVNLVDFEVGNGEKGRIYVKRPTLFKADKDHIHHRLLSFGLSHWKTVIIFYGVCAAICTFGIIVVIWGNHGAVLLLGAVIFASFIGIKSLDYRELKIFENGLFLPLYRLPLVNKILFQTFVDLLFISLSYYLSFNLVFGTFGSVGKALFLRTLPVVFALKIIIFYLCGLYRETWRDFNTEKIINLSKALIFSTVAAAVVLVGLFGSRAFSGMLFFVLDFYIMVSLMAGSRISYKLLNFLYSRANSKRDKKVLIYGANGESTFLVNEIRYNGLRNLKPVGFVDDNPEMKGKNHQGYPVLGTSDDLDSIFKNNGFSEVILSDRKISADNLRKITFLCQQKGIGIKQLELKLESLPQ